MLLSQGSKTHVLMRHPETIPLLGTTQDAGLPWATEGAYWLRWMRAICAPDLTASRTMSWQHCIGSGHFYHPAAKVCISGRPKTSEAGRTASRRLMASSCTCCTTIWRTLSGSAVHSRLMPCRKRHN